MDVLKEHLQDWGNLYQIIVATVFGFISIVLWNQDRKKSALILELQKQTNLIANQLEYLITRDSPMLTVEQSEYWMEAYVLIIKNNRGNLLDLKFNLASDAGVFSLGVNNKPNDLAPGNTFQLRYHYAKQSDRTTGKSDSLTITYKDQYGSMYTQKLSLAYMNNGAHFKPAIVTKALV